MIRLARCFAGLGLAMLALACGSGVSAEQATTFCDQEQTSIGTDNFGSKSYDQCISCYEKCGQQCIRMSTAPTTYACK